MCGINDTQLVDRIPSISGTAVPRCGFPTGDVTSLKYLKVSPARSFAMAQDLHWRPRRKIEDGDRPGDDERGHVIGADNVVVCTNTPVNDWLSSQQAGAYRTYVMVRGFRKLRAARTVLGYPHPITTSNTTGEDSAGRELDYDILIVGGRITRRQRATTDKICPARAMSRERFSMIESVQYRLVGQVMEPVDYLAYIGRNPGGDEHIYIATETREME